MSTEPVFPFPVINRWYLERISSAIVIIIWFNYNSSWQSISVGTMVNGHQSFLFILIRYFWSIDTEPSEPIIIYNSESWKGKYIGPDMAPSKLTCLWDAMFYVLPTNYRKKICTHFNEQMYSKNGLLFLL